MASAGSAIVLAGLFATDSIDNALRAIGAKPRPLPRAEDTSLLSAVVADQQHVLAVALGAEATTVAELLSAQLKQLGANPTKETEIADLESTLRQAATNRAADSVSAISPQFAQVLASMSAGLTQAVTLA
mgnify:FL=1